MSDRLNGWAPHIGLGILFLVIVAIGMVATEPTNEIPERTMPGTVYVNPFPPVASSAPSRPVQVIWIGEDYTMGFDAQAGDSVNVVMYPDGDPEARCNDMGGVPGYNAWTLIWTCRQVDF